MNERRSVDPDFRVLFESAPGLYLVLSVDLTIVAVSDAYLRATMTKREEILGRFLFDVFPDNPDDPSADGTTNLRASLDRVREARRADTMPTQKYDIQKPKAEGGGFEERYWSPVNTPVVNSRGELAYIIHRVEDVTEEVRLEAQAQTQARERLALDEVTQETNQFLEAILENIPHMVFVKDAERLAFVRFNRAGEKLLGVSRTELLGKTDHDFFPETEAAFFQAKDRETLGGRVLVDIKEEQIQTKNGSRLLHTKKVPILDANGAPRYLLGISEDITEHKAAEDAIAEKNRELEIGARIDRIGARVMVALNERDPSGTPAKEVLRVLAEEAGYRPLAFYEYDEWQGGLVLRAGLSLAPEYDKKRFGLGEGLVGEAAARRESLFVDETPNSPLALDTGVGTLPVASLFAVPLVHRDRLLGVVAGASQTLLLERERRWLTHVGGQVAIGLHAIHQFRELRAVSEQLNERTRKIEAQNQELARANRLKSEFLASMSHELRTPLNAIIGFSEALRDGLLGELPDNQREYTAEIFDSGQHLLSLINDILDLSKIEAGRMELEIERVEIPELVKNALTIVGELAAKEGITLAQSIDPAVSVIDADKRKLRQVVYNLLSNAVKFTPPGGTVRVEVTREGSDVVLSFVDTGIGIAPESIPRLFRPFEQLDAGLARKFQGTGLGLVMVKNLVELHGGVVEVESEVGVGSRFWVRLPSSREGARSVMPEARPTTPLVRSTSRSPQVLVIDDDPAAILLARGWLENAGYQVFGASTCDVAWATIQKRPPDIILLDILFEYGPSGWELLGRLRSAPSFAKIPVIVVSIVAELGRGLALGAVQVLQKPVAGADLLDAIASTGITLGEAAHVLVVDDDPRAVEHVSKRLEDAGMVVTRSYGGEDALLALQKRTYAAMVLDLLMPGMNGFDVIRSLRSTDAPPLPIVVLTAKTLDASEQELLERSVHSVLSKNGWDETRFLSVIRKAVHESSFDGAASAPRPKPLRIDDDEGGRGE